MSVFSGLSWFATGTLLKTIAGVEFVDEERHATSAKQTARGTHSLLQRAAMRGHNTIDLLHEPK